MEFHRAQRIRAALTPKRRELFDLMLTEVAAGRWEELAPENTKGLITIRWRATRRTPDIYLEHSRTTSRTWDELVFVSMRTLKSGPSLSRAAGPLSGVSQSDLTLTKALAVVADPVAALDLAPVPVLRWGLLWSDGTAEPGIRFDAEDQVVSEREQYGIIAGHAARHSCNGVVTLNDKLIPASCRGCGAVGVLTRDVVYHPWKAELFEEVPVDASS